MMEAKCVGIIWMRAMGICLRWRMGSDKSDWRLGGDGRMLRLEKLQKKLREGG
jgi:hypothetical protein